MTKNKPARKTPPPFFSIGALIYLERCHRNPAAFSQKAIDALNAAGRAARGNRKLFDFVGAQ